LEEFAPKVVYVKGIYNMVADAISQLDYNPTVNPNNKWNHATHGMSMKVKGETIAKWKTFSKLWLCYNKYNTKTKTQECNLN
jgi:hypothetical protein